MILKHRFNKIINVNINYKPVSPYYVHLKNHNQKITPQRSRKNFWYMNPKIIGENVPQQQKKVLRLPKRYQEILEKKLFHQFKEKILQGKIDVDKQKIIDPLWGQQKPKHYYKDLSYSELNSVSHALRLDMKKQIDGFEDQFFKKLKQFAITQQTSIKQMIDKMKNRQLVQFALWIRKADIQIPKRQIFHQIETKLLVPIYKLTTDELLNLKFAFQFPYKFGRPNFNQIMKDLLEEDIPNMNKNQLIKFFYILKNHNYGIGKIQEKIIEQLKKKYYSSMSIQQKIDFLLIYTNCRKPLISKPVRQQIGTQKFDQVFRFLYELNLQSLTKQDLNQQLCCKLVYSLVLLKAFKCKFLGLQILQFLQETDITKFSAHSIYILTHYLPLLENQEGLYSEQLFKKLFQQNLKHWQQYQTIHKIRIIYSFWNLGLWSQQVQKLYHQLEITPDSSVLNYFCQIQMKNSSGRQWQVITYISQLDYVPLVYYQNYTRFYHYLRNVSQWDLSSIKQKLQNTEHYFDVLRQEQIFKRSYNFYDQFEKFIFFIEGRNKYIRKNFKYDKIFIPFGRAIPIRNFQCSMYGQSQYQISIDVVNQRECLPGTNKLKPSYLNKIDALQYVGWKHLAVHQDQFTQLNLVSRIEELSILHTPFIDQQLQKIAYENYNKGIVLQTVRAQSRFKKLYSHQIQQMINNKGKKSALQQARERLQMAKLNAQEPPPPPKKKKK